MDNNQNINQVELLQDERILLFLQGKMTVDEEKLLMDDLQKDADFKARAINVARLAKGIKQVGEEKDRILKEALLSADESSIRQIAVEASEQKFEKKVAVTINEEGHKKSAKVASLKRKYTTVLSIAASLLFVVYFGLQYYDYSKTTSLGEQFASPYDTSIARGDEQPAIEAEIHGLIDNVYNNKNLDSSLKRLAVLWEVSTLETYNDYTDYAPEIGWALAIGYLKDNNKSDASEVLKKMVTLYDAETVIGRKARELQKKIADL